ncbi:LUD domain-containing protein [Gilvimarinus sp. SDUM040013]|uniref:LUD domain-containing protein n=1 Tax=Gilvimarinus gilvus TaxID=3058038 RepID=A0ABU4RYX8_9GAMM|nr:LUD domain-containing protein [Gilvimarinus sp. SDUM040013]MDO3386657.1 LUD domain-containing protein [Gilvimarinus sp. SDUM040013]MDX6849456.1 LUD domain-containing protein [Gilvimarinus sp. SDUM040013]
MTDSRSRILDRIARHTGGEYDADSIEASFQALAQSQTVNSVQPEMGLTDPIATFIEEARRNGARVANLKSMDQVTQWLRDNARHTSTEVRFHLAPNIIDRSLDWSGLNTTEQTPAAAGSWGVVQAHTGIAETGTVMSLSNECPSGLLFLVERLVIVIARKDIVGYQEDAWQRLRACSALPRTVNWITGPSRTADIEQQIQIGAHGPREADYLIIDSP